MKKMQRCNAQPGYRKWLVTLGILVGCLSSGSADPLRIVTWGGAYEAAQRQALFEPYEEKSGRTIEVLQYNGSLEEMRRRARREKWDLVDMTEDLAIAACQEGLVQPINHQEVFLKESFRALKEDFAPLRLTDCAIPQEVYALVLAYDDRAFPGRKPDSVEDFFDVQQFPGKRAVQKTPDGLLEWALLAEGVPQRQIYDLLSTDRGLRLALQNLEGIRDQIVWWEDPAEPARMLERGEVVMASGYNGRFFFATQERDAPIVTIWDGQLIGTDVWVMARDADTEAALHFLQFATQAERMADLAELIPYGPARTSALDQIGLHPNSNIPMRDHLPNARLSSGRYLIRDPEWYANTQSLRNRRFRSWLQEDDK